jgi:membrane protein DedA with SNARE-associated domain
MRPRHAVLLTYLFFLAASTGVRWQEGELASRDQGGLIFGGGVAPEVLVVADAGMARGPVPTFLEEATAGRRVSVIEARTNLDDELRSLGGRAIHLIAIGTGGGPAILAAASDPGMVRSLTLIDADGIEEFDLLGDHHLNQVLRRAQVVASDALRWGLPHFGILDHGILRADRARALLAQDRRGIRAALARWGGPTLILTHDSGPGRLATSREQARLLPQALLRSSSIETLRTFLGEVDAGTAPTRTAAPPDRISAAGLPFDAGGIASAQGSSLLVVLVLLALATLLSEDLACVAAGVLAARGSIPLWPGILACYIGIVIGDQLLYLLGRSAGRALVTRVPLKWILSTERLDRAYEWFRTHGMKVVLTSRLLPGTRSTVYVAAGILRAGFVKFALWLVVIGAIWTPALVGLSYVATRQGRGLLEALPGPTWPWALGAMIGGTLLIRSLLSAATPEGRAGLAARWRSAKAPH